MIRCWAAPQSRGVKPRCLLLMLSELSNSLREQNRSKLPSHMAPGPGWELKNATKSSSCVRSGRGHQVRRPRHRPRPASSQAELLRSIIVPGSSRSICLGDHPSPFFIDQLLRLPHLQPMSSPFSLRLFSPDSFRLTVTKNVRVSAWRKLKRTIKDSKIIHLHFTILVLRLKPLWENKIAHLYSINCVDARLNRIAYFIRHKRFTPPPRFISVETQGVKIDARIGQHFEHFVRYG